MMTDPSSGGLLTLAGDVCTGRQPLPGMSRARASCLLTRQALEQVVDALLEQEGLGCPGASMRARLLCLVKAYEDDPRPVASRAATAWHRLSAACHHHAYELGPTVGEARALVDEVSWLDEQRLERVRAAWAVSAGISPASCVGVQAPWATSSKS